MTTKLIFPLIEEFKKAKYSGEAAMAQLTDQQLLIRINPRQNSIAVIVKHLHGNLLSRFTDFLTSDGEKPSRNREQEFVEEIVGRDQIMRWWNEGWACLLGALANLSDDDLLKTVTIRTEPFTVIGAIARSMSHCAYHMGQILLLAKHIKGDGWKYITIAPGQSSAFNQKMGVK
jgi:uncharacterized damage-inducible protein DinB